MPSSSFQADAVLYRVAAEGSREGVQVFGPAAVVDQLEEAGQECAPLGGAVGGAVASQCRAEGVDDRAGICEAQCCRVEAFTGPLGQGAGGDGQGAHGVGVVVGAWGTGGQPVPEQIA